jgi:hypothetical protein
MAEFKRSRLKTKEEEEITKKTIFLGLTTILVIVGLLVFGLPMLIRLSIILGEARVKRSKEVKEKVIPPPQPRLVTAFEATNSAKINLTGFSEKGMQIVLLKNDVSLSQTQANENGEFAFEDIDLDQGANQFSATATSVDGVSSDPSKPIQIVLDDQAPEITMINPSEDTLTVDYADFDVAGKTEKGASVTVNGRVAMVDDEGKFKIKFQLNAGNNEIELKIRDLAGNETKKKLTIKYDI